MSENLNLPKKNSSPRKKTPPVLEYSASNKTNNILVSKDAENVFDFSNLLKKLDKTTTTYKEAQKFIKNGLASKESSLHVESIQKIINLLKTEKIAQVIIQGGKKSKINNFEGRKGKSGEAWPLQHDIDSKSAIIFLNNYNKRNTGELYEADGSMTTFRPKGGTEKDTDEVSSGLIVYLDNGGKWLEVEKDGKKTRIYIDHHGKGKRKSTSATKMIFELMKEAGILEEEPWMQNYVDMINDYDNQDYTDRVDSNGKKIMNKKTFSEVWPYTWYHLAPKIDPMVLMNLYKKGIIKDYRDVPSDKDIQGALGKIKLLDKKLHPSIHTETIADEIAFERSNRGDVSKTISGISRVLDFAEKQNWDLNSTELGKLVIHDFSEIKDERGKNIKNIIPDHLAFIGTKAFNRDTYIQWNEQRSKFFINSRHKNLEKVVAKLNSAYPDCALEVRGEMVFGKILAGMTKEKFFDLIDEKILKHAKKQDSEPVEPPEPLTTQTTEVNIDGNDLKTLAEKISSGEKLSPEEEAIKEKIGDILASLLNKDTAQSAAKEDVANSKKTESELKDAIIGEIEGNENEPSKNEEAIKRLLARKEEIEKRLQEIQDEKFGVNTYRVKKNWLQRTWRKIFNF